jgi:hypothetical protein
MSEITAQLRASIAYRQLVRDIERISGSTFTPEQRAAMVRRIAETVGAERRLRLVGRDSERR